MFSTSLYSSTKKSTPATQSKRGPIFGWAGYRAAKSADSSPVLSSSAPAQPKQQTQSSRIEYLSYLIQQGLDFTFTPKTPSVTRDEVTKASERTRAEILAAAQKNAEQAAFNEAEEAARSERIRLEMANQHNEPASVVIGEEMDVEEDASAGLIELRKKPVDESELQTIRDILKNRNVNGQNIVIDKFNIDITISKINCLRPNTWLNDEIVNFYMCMLQERDQKLCAEANGARQPSHYFNSFFIAKLLENGQYTYGNVKRWSKKFDVFSMDRIFMPINLNNTHWVMSVAYIQRKEIHYYDSMSGSGQRHLQAILRWLGDESKEKKKTELDTTGWKLIDREQDVPQQENGYDCGVFSIICADFKSDDLPLQYEQSEMSLNRVKIGAAIRRGYLTY